MSIRVVRWAPTVLAVVGVGIFLTLTRGVDLRDESWSLQVVNRVLAGETLYSEVYWVATPLSVWLPVVAGKVLGSGMLLLKGLTLTVFVGTVLLTWRVAQQAGATAKGAALAAIGAAVYAGPATHPQYTALAAMLCLASLSALLTWLSRREKSSADGPSPARVLLLAGVLAGLSFSSKQTIGAGALAAVLLTVIAQPPMAGGWRRKLTVVGVATGGAVGAVAIVLAPVVATGAFGDFLNFAFGAGERFRLTEVSYLEGLRESLDVSAGSAALAAYRLVTEAPVFVLPVLAFAALAIALVRGRRRLALAVVALFAVVALASAYPQFNARLLSRAAPFMLVGLACAAPALPLRPGARKALFACAAAWLAFVLAATLGKPLNSLRNGDYRFSSLPHFEGALMGQERLGVEANAAQLKAATPAPSSTLMVSADGSFYSLVTGLRNPTRYDDLQGLTTLGEQGTREVVRAIDGGEVTAVCVGRIWSDERLRPSALIAYVEKHLRRGSDAGPCVMYER